jgi:hypothetical protein
MSVKPIDNYLQRLDAIARSANAAEDAYRREAAERIKELERERAFSFRRLTLVSAIARSMAGANEEAEAIERGSDAFLREIGWTGATESQRQVLERFKPIIKSLWRMSRDEPPAVDVQSIDVDLAAFEAWFAENRNGTFLSLMDAEPLELPLVDV